MLKQYYSNFIVVTSIIVKLYFLFSLLALVPNSIMGQVCCIPKLTTVRSVHFRETGKPENKLTRDHLSCQKHHILFSLSFAHNVWQHSLYFKNHQERNAFMDTCGKSWKRHYILFSTSVDVHKNKTCYEIRVLKYNVALFPPGQGVWPDSISFLWLL